MRKLVSSFFISLDGVVEAPHDWHFPYFDEEMGAVSARPSRPATRSCSAGGRTRSGRRSGRSRIR